MHRIQYRWQGVTLIELVIAIAIIGVIASLAYPSYQNSVMKSRRTDATSALLKLQMDQEKHRANNPTYAASVTGGGATGLAWPSDVTENGYYKIEIAPNNAPGNAVGFIATATAETGTSQANDTLCTVITIDQDGAAGVLDCW